MREVCIMVAPNGARRTQADHPRLPMSAEELARTARECFAAGAGAIHLHVRDEQGRHSLDPHTYQVAIAAIRRGCEDIVIQTTTEAAGAFDLDAQIDSVKRLRPSCLSFSTVELMREGEEKGRRFLAWAAEIGIAIQFILYNSQQIADFDRLWRAGSLHLTDAPRLIIVAGRYSASQDSELSEFEALYAALASVGLHEKTEWMTCAFGRGEMACLERTIELGGHVRVGFENAIVDSAGRPARDNAERVALVAALAAKHGRAPATPAQCGAILGKRIPGVLIDS